MTLKDYIKSYFGISNVLLQDVAVLFKPEILEKNAFFIKEDQYCDKLSFISKGHIRVYKCHEEKEVTQWIGTDGFFLTDLSSFIFDTRSNWNIQALSDTELLTINKSDYARLKSIVPDWDTAEKRFIAGCFITIENRLFQHLSMSAEERYDILYKQNSSLFNEVPLQYIASMLAITPETLSRIRNKKRNQ